jgi:hypothetical protein
MLFYHTSYVRGTQCTAAGKLTLLISTMLYGSLRDYVYEERIHP